VRNQNLGPLRILFGLGVAVGLQVLRQRVAVFKIVLARERLPQEIVVLDGKITGQSFHAFAVQVNNVPVHLALHGLVLFRRNPQAEAHQGVTTDQFDQAVVEERRNGFVEDRFLFFLGLGFQNAPGILARQPTQAVDEAQQITEFRVIVHVFLEILNPRATDPAIQPGAFPETSGLGIEVFSNVLLVQPQVGLVIRRAEKLKKGVVGRQMLQRGQLQARKKNVVAVDVHGGDRSGAFDQVIHDVAAARGDRQNAAVPIEFQRLKVYAGVFPDLIVDETVKPEGKKPLHEAAAAGKASGIDRLFDQRGIGHRRAPNNPNVRHAPPTRGEPSAARPAKGACEGSSLGFACQGRLSWPHSLHSRHKYSASPPANKTLPCDLTPNA
jgi:hypothetical protein